MQPDWLAKGIADGSIKEGPTAKIPGSDNPKNPGLSPGKKKRKYRNEPVVVDGERFDSKKEARRWGILKVLEQSGAILSLRRQVRYELVVNGIEVSHYTADFVYQEANLKTRTWNEVVEDTKSEATCQDRAYGIRKKLMKALYGIEILEV